MSMRVAVQDCKIRKFGNRLDLTGCRDHPAGDPVPISQAVRQVRALHGFDESLQRPDPFLDHICPFDLPFRSGDPLETLEYHPHRAQVAQDSHPQ